MKRAWSKIIDGNWWYTVRNDTFRLCIYTWYILIIIIIMRWWRWNDIYGDEMIYIIYIILSPSPHDYDKYHKTRERQLTSVMTYMYWHIQYLFCFNTVLQRGYRLQTSESDVYIRQILTSKVDPSTVRMKPFIIVIETHIQMKRKELTKTFMMIYNLKNPLVFMVYTKIFQRFKE